MPKAPAYLYYAQALPSFSENSASCQTKLKIPCCVNQLIQADNLTKENASK